MIEVGMKFSLQSPPNAREHGCAVVYRLRNSVNDKIYIGSAKNFRNRFVSYKASLSAIKNQTPIARAMRKHGLAAFEFEIVERVIDIKDLLAREQHWIDSEQPFRPKGYNVCPTAGSMLGMKMSDSAKAKIRASAMSRIDVLIARTSKPLYQIDTQTLNIINTFSSVKEASISSGADGPAIGGCCNYKEQTTGGFYWRWREDYDKNGFVHRKLRRGLTPGFFSCIRPIAQTTEAGDLVKIWDCAKAVSDKFGWERKCITECCNRSNPHRVRAYGFRWTWVEDEHIITEIKNKRKLQYEESKNG